MSIISKLTMLKPFRRILAYLLGLSQPTHSINVHVKLSFVTSDGITLSGKLWEPSGVDQPPVILIRSPYGIGAVSPFAVFFAERGMSVFVQACRGTDSSSGELTPFENEAQDGKETVKWIEDQSWFHGKLFVWGPSYLSYTALAVAVTNPSSLIAGMPFIAVANTYDIVHKEGGLALELVLSWFTAMKKMDEISFDTLSIRGLMGIANIFRSLEFDRAPVDKLDSYHMNTVSEPYQKWISDPRINAQYWKKVNLIDEVSNIKPPMYLISGWHDFALQSTLDVYRELVASGKNPRLTIGNFGHSSLRSMLLAIQEGLTWFSQFSEDNQKTEDSQNVRYHVQGSKKWLKCEEWPPRNVAKEVLYLGSSGNLINEKPTLNDSPSRFVYNPDDPTPSHGGPFLIPGYGHGGYVVKDSYINERNDVLYYASQPMKKDTTIVGEIAASIHYHSDLPSSDLFVRINRVGKNGHSYNVTEGFKRIDFDQSSDKPQKVELTLSPTAVEIRKGECISVTVSAGSFPLYSRNLGTSVYAEQIGESTGPSANLSVHHNALMPSAIILPVLSI